MSTKVRIQWKSISRYIRAPFKFLIRARDFYVKSCSDCAANVPVSNYAAVGFRGYPTFSEFSTYLPQISSFNSSVSRNDDEFRDLIRAASTRSTVEIRKSELLLLSKNQSIQSPTAMGRAVTVVPRTQSTVAVFGRIDENQPYGQSAEDIKMTTDRVFPRSRSHEITNRRASAF